MKFLQKFRSATGDFFARYPALLSGLILYGYLLFTIVRFFIRAHSERVTFLSVFEAFDALPFMWFLATSLVHIINLRTRFFESERQRLAAEQSAQVSQTQITTLHQIIRSLQHHINNPLAIITLAVGAALRAADANKPVTRQLETIRDSAKNIDDVLSKLSASEVYQVEPGVPEIGPMTKV